MSVVFKDNSSVAKREMEEAVGRALEMIGLQAESYAKLELENPPRRIDTGNLRNSIGHQVIGDTAYIGTNVDYGIYVHEGTQKMLANRFLRNAVEKHAEQYRQIAQDQMKK